MERVDMPAAIFASLAGTRRPREEKGRVLHRPARANDLDARRNADVALRSIPSPSASAPKLSNFKARGEFALRFVRCKVSAYNGDIAIART
jgi:hypothetical protein